MLQILQGGTGVDLVLEPEHAAERLSLRVGVPCRRRSSGVTLGWCRGPELLDTSNVHGSVLPYQRRRLGHVHVALKCARDQEALLAYPLELVRDHGCLYIREREVVRLQLCAEEGVQGARDGEPVRIKRQARVLPLGAGLRCRYVKELCVSFVYGQELTWIKSLPGPHLSSARNRVCSAPELDAVWRGASVWR